mgnify:CR=1 FL=1
MSFARQSAISLQRSAGMERPRARTMEHRSLSVPVLSLPKHRGGRCGALRAVFSRQSTDDSGHRMRFAQALGARRSVQGGGRGVQRTARLAAVRSDSGVLSASHCWWQ